MYKCNHSIITITYCNSDSVVIIIVNVVMSTILTLALVADREVFSQPASLPGAACGPLYNEHVYFLCFLL